jgi:hypothetical protein
MTRLSSKNGKIVSLCCLSSEQRIIVKCYSQQCKDRLGSTLVLIMPLASSSLQAKR